MTPNPLDLIKWFFGLGWIGVIFIFLLFPDQVQKWSAIFWSLAYRALKLGRKKAIAIDLQSKIQDFSKQLNKEVPGMETSTIAVKWVDKDDNDDAFFKENRLVVRLRDPERQVENIVKTTMIYISKGVLPKIKNHLSKPQRTSIDLFVANNLIKDGKERVAEEFIRSYLTPELSSDDKIRTYYDKYTLIQRVGLFYPILIQELFFLGQKVFFTSPGEEVQTEVDSLINFLERHANRDVGDDTSELNFEGLYCKCGIVIVGKKHKVRPGEEYRYTEWISGLIRSGINHIYLIGDPGTESKQFIANICARITVDFNFVVQNKKRYTGYIKKGAERMEVRSFIVMLKNLVEQTYVDSETQIMAKEITKTKT